MRSSKKIIYLSLAVLAMFALFYSAAISFASDQEFDEYSYVVRAFKSFKTITPNVTVPRVVKVLFNNSDFSIPSFAVYNMTGKNFEPYLLMENTWESNRKVTVSSNRDVSKVSDGNYQTFEDFPLTSNMDSIELIFRFDKPITTSSLTFALDNYVALPQSISVTSSENGRSDNVVLAPVRPTGGTVFFPKTTSALWAVRFEYVQPLRIAEMKFSDDLSMTDQIINRELRFLAQPGQSYKIYFDPDRYVAIATKEGGNLYLNEGVVAGESSEGLKNTDYTPADADGDMVPDMTDNCVSVPNADQKDLDGNGRGDACEDYDRDGVVAARDNCVDLPNSGQQDTDIDGKGDACDTEDNRLGQEMPWLPWLGIGIAFVVVLGLFVIVLKHKPTDLPPDMPQ